MTDNNIKDTPSNHEEFDPTPFGPDAPFSGHHHPKWKDQLYRGHAGWLGILIGEITARLTYPLYFADLQVGERIEEITKSPTAPECFRHLSGALLP